MIGTAAGLEGMISWKTLTKQKFDQAAFRKGQPELYQAYSTAIFERRFLPKAGAAQADSEEEEVV